MNGIMLVQYQIMGSSRTTTILYDHSIGRRTVAWDEAKSVGPFSTKQPNQ